MRLPGPLTTRVFSSLDQAALSPVGGSGGSSQLDALLSLDASLRALHAGETRPPSFPFVRQSQSRLPLTKQHANVDVAICGGTLGLLLGCALQLSGHSVGVIEGGPLRGREQDWNTSLEELNALVEQGVLTESELPRVAPLAFGPMRCAFGPSPSHQLSLHGVLDIAVSPSELLRIVRARFEAAGGVVMERTRVAGVTIHTDGARLCLGEGAEGGMGVHCQLVVDCMGHASPIARQQRFARGQRPDGVCIQVGSCSSYAGWGERWGSSADFFTTESDATPGGPNGKARVQYFWQAFPTSGEDEDERSTYMFTYLKPDREMPSLLEAMEEYWTRLPAYQGNRLKRPDDPLEEINVRRVLFGWFPTYRRDSPLPPHFDRVLSIGDASAVQSPISFGGFCAMLRHLPRLRRGLDLALRSDSLRSSDLACLAPYLPNLGTAWMSASAMTARVVETPAEPSKLVNRLLEGNFKVMDTWMPRSQAVTFFRDVTTLETLSIVLVAQTATMAPLLPSVVAEIGALELLEFGYHYVMLVLYTVLFAIADTRGALTLDEPTKEAFRRSCRLDAWRYGSGLD
ncbi:MAG: hypothetical protein SGPRY_010671 [Prymnesium sp.]